MTAESPILETSKADRGLVIDNERVTELPLNARNPFMLSYLTPGITYNGPAIYQRPFDNGAIADWSINGGQNRNNEFLLDGAPNNSIQGGNNIAYVPPVDSVQEFKIVTNSYDAQYGRTAGGVVNVSLKSGTNNFHGSLYEFARRKALDSNEYFFKVNNREKPNHKLDQYGFEIDGPVIGLEEQDLLHVQLRGLQGGDAESGDLHRPGRRPAQGRFQQSARRPGTSDHDLRSEHGPARERPVGARSVSRQRDSGQPHRSDGAAASHSISCSRIPRRRQAAIRGGTTSSSRRTSRSTRSATSPPRSIRTSVTRTRMYVRYAYNKRTEERYTNGITTGPAQDGQLPLVRINHSGVADWVRTLSSSLVFNVRAGLNQYLELARSDPGLGFNPADLGLPPVAGQPVAEPGLPAAQLHHRGHDPGLRAEPDRHRRIPAARPKQPEQRDDDGVQPAAELLVGEEHAQRSRRPRHAADVVHARDQRNLFVLTFDRRFTQRAFNLSDALSGNAIASFLLGAPAGGAIDNNFYPTFRWNYYAPWVQDDWKVTDRLTLNLGLRWDLNTPVFEKDNRLNYGFDTTTINPVSSRINQQQFPGYQVRGGLGFVDVDGNPQYPYPFDKNNIQPRAGFAYLLGDKTVVRGGYGLYYLNVVGISASNGFGIQTPLVTSLDGDRTSTYPFSNPFSQGMAPRARIVARAPDVPRPRPELLEPRLRQSVRAPVLARGAARAAVAHDDRARLRRQPYDGGAEPVGRLQRAAARAAQPVRSDAEAGALRSATSFCRIRSTRCPGSKGRRGSRARRSRATS